MVIRDARDEELTAIGQLLVEAYRQYFPSDDAGPQVQKAWAEYRAEILDVRNRALTTEQIIAQTESIGAVGDGNDGGRILGSVTYYRPGDMTYEHAAFDLPKTWAGIRLLGVHPDARGQGLGRALTEACVTRAREQGAEEMLLHTTELMRVARAMYERMGFARFPDLDFYPIEGNDFCVMAYRMTL